MLISLCVQWQLPDWLVLIISTNSLVNPPKTAKTHLTFINNNTYRTRSLQSNNFYFRMQFYSSRSTYATSSESSVCIFNEGDRCKKESNLKIRVNKKKIKICKNIFKNITMKKKRKWWMRSTKKIHKRIFISSHFAVSHWTLWRSQNAKKNFTFSAMMI